MRTFAYAFFIALAGSVLVTESGRAAVETTTSFGDQVAVSDLEYYGLTPAAEANKSRLGATLFIDTYYDSNIFIANTGERGDFVTLIKPYITYETNPDGLMGQTHEFGVYYAPEFLLFASTDSENAINHSAQAAYRYNGDNSFFNLSHRFRQSSGADLDIGGRSNLLQHVSLLNGGVDFLEDYQFLYGGKQNLRYYDVQNDRHDWQLYGFLLREVNKRLKLGVGARGGWVDTALSPNQTYEQILGRLMWDIRKSLSVDLEAGVDLRQYEGLLAIDDTSTFTYNARLLWQLREGTSLAVSAYRDTLSSSGLIAANYDVTGFRAELTQRVTDDLDAQIGGGYENADYYSTVTTATTPLEFDYIFIRPALIWNPTERLLFELYYRFSESDASVVGRDFDRHQVGLQTTIEF